MKILSMGMNFNSLGTRIIIFNSKLDEKPQQFLYIDIVTIISFRHFIALTSIFKINYIEND